MLSIKHIQSEWDNKSRDPLYKFDQDFLELVADKPFSDMKMLPDIRVDHLDEGKPHAFFAHRYHDGDLISFVHHDNPLYPENCSGKPIGHKYHDGCGFAGAVMEFELKTGLVKVKGAWSSGEYHWNQVSPNDPRLHCAVYTPDYEHTASSASVKVDLVLSLIKKQNLPYVLVTGLGVDNNPLDYEIVHKDDVAQFILNGGIHPIWMKKREERGEPIRRWLGQSEEQFRAGIENAKVWR